MILGEQIYSTARGGLALSVWDSCLDNWRLLSLQRFSGLWPPNRLPWWSSNGTASLWRRSSNWDCIHLSSLQNFVIHLHTSVAVAPLWQPAGWLFLISLLRFRRLHMTLCFHGDSYHQDWWAGGCPNSFCHPAVWRHCMQTSLHLSHWETFAVSTSIVYLFNLSGLQVFSTVYGPQYC